MKVSTRTLSVCAAAALLAAPACYETSGGADAGPDAGCSSSSCGEARACCGGRCVNVANDPRNCGRCGMVCGAGTYCGAGMCVEPPCTTTCAGGAFCCGGSCCTAGQLCCDPQGPIDVEPRCTDPDDRGTCPTGCAPLCICASPETPIATPDGDRPIASLSVGDLVYSVDGGALDVVPIVRTRHSAVENHRVIRVTLENGSVLEISAGHPTADGRTFAELARGSRLDRWLVTSAETIPYTHPFTYDILPGSDTGTYVAGGALIGSTLAPGR